MPYLRNNVVGLLLFPALLLAADSIQLNWSDLAQFSGPQHRVRITLDDQNQVQARLLRVEDDALVCDVLKSTDKRIRSGEMPVPRNRIRVFEVRRETKSARKQGFLIGATTGALMRVLGGAMADRSRDISTGQAIGIAAGTGLALWGGVGYLIGRPIDRRFTRVEIR